MAKLKIAPELCLEVSELNHLIDGCDSLGFRKNILENSVSFGLIKNSADPTFANARVTRDVDSGGDKTIKINPVLGIDNLGQFIYSPDVINQIPLTDDGNYYWLKLKYASSNLETGTLSIAVNGDVTGVNTQFTKLRGLPNFPSRVKLVGTINNILEYNVLEVIDDAHMILANPAVGVSGLAEFIAESDLQYKVVGTFTNGVVIDADNKYPFVYDSISYELVQETVLGQKPTPFVEGQEFYVARILVSGIDVIIQDQRTEYWQTKGSGLVYEIDRNENPLIGVEAVKWQVKTSPADKNIVEVAWNFRSANWSINSSQNIVTLSSGLGGKYKSVADFTDGDLDGFRLYTANGKYSNIVSSVKVGGAINLTVDVLFVPDYSDDFGTTMITQTLVVAPNADEIEFLCQSAPGDNTTSVNQTVSFNIKDEIGKIELEVYKTPSVLYNIQYRYKKIAEFTGWTAIPTDTVSGYLVETSFDENGVLTGTTRQTYTSDPTAGFITLNMCPWSYSTTIDTIFNEDLIGVNEIETLSATTTYLLTVGTDKHYQLIKGTQAIGSDTIFTLSTALPCRDGSTFKIHFNCDQLTLGGNVIYIKQGSTVLKQITMADVYQMYNTDNGIIFSFVYDEDNGAWVGSQNYTVPSTAEIKMVPGDPSAYFNTGTGLGNVKTWFGWKIYNALIGRAPIGAGGYTDASGTYTRTAGDTGGIAKHQLTESELAAHNHDFTSDNHNHSFSGSPHDHQTLNSFSDTVVGSNGVGDKVATGDWPSNPPGAETSGTLSSRTSSETASGTIGNNTVSGTTDNAGGGDYHENMMPWLALTFAQWIG